MRFILKEQKRDGWWAVFQATDDQANASTFGTAWALIGLQTQLQNKLIPQTMEEEVSNAIGKGSNWLIRHRESGSRWKDYPFHEKGEKSDSLSGLVMHALHLTAPNSITQLKKDWLNKLELSKVPSSRERSQSFLWVRVRGGAPGQGLLRSNCATVDVDRNSGRVRCRQLLERTRALLWMERALNQESVIHADTQVDNWWRAEFLLALRYVAG